MIPESGGLAICLKALHLSSFAACFQEMSGTAESQGWSHQQYLQHLAEIELEDRRQDRIERLLKASGLPRDKTLASLDMTVLPERVKKMLPSLCEGYFLGRSENIVAFGLPGRGKTHLLCAIGHELVLRGHQVLFIPAYRLVQKLRKRSIRRVLSGRAGSGRSSDRDDKGAGIEMLGQKGLALGIGGCRRQVFEEVAQVAVWLQAIGLGRLNEGVNGGRGVGSTRVA